MENKNIITFCGCKRYLREREAYNNKSNALVQTWHLCWSMFLKSSIIRCLPNAVVKVPSNCWERILNIAVFKCFRNDILKKKKKKIIITATEIIIIQLFPYSVVSKQKIKMKARNTMVLSYYSKVTSTQNKGGPFFLFVYLVS